MTNSADAWAGGWGDRKPSAWWQAVAPLPTSEHSQEVTAAVAELLKQIGPKERKRNAVSFDAALKRCHPVAELLENLPAPLDVHQRMDLADAIAELRATAAGLGVASSTTAKIKRTQLRRTLAGGPCGAGCPPAN